MAKLRRLLAMATMLAAPIPAFAADLEAALAGLRGDCQAQPDTRCASPQVEPIKRALRLRVEHELTTAPATVDPARIERKLGLALPRAGGHGGCASDDEDADSLGQTGLSLRRDGDWLELRTSVGITCASDESAYLYHWDGGWRRVWQAEYSYAKGGSYRPRHLTNVRHDRAHNLVLAAGVEEWCSSTWHQIYYQLWRAAPGQQQQLLLDGRDYAYLSEIVGPLETRLDGDGLTVEYMVASIDPAQHSRLATRHYRLDGDRPRRVDPIALTPVNFVEEWLSAPWQQSAAWTEAAARGTAQGWHAATRDRRTGGSLLAEAPDDDSRALRCRGDTSLWQVAVNFPEARQSRQQAWFLVRWTEPYRFRLAAVGARPWPNCLYFVS